MDYMEKGIASLTIRDGNELESLIEQRYLTFAVSAATLTNNGAKCLKTMVNEPAHLANIIQLISYPHKRNSVNAVRQL